MKRSSTAYSMIMNKVRFNSAGRMKDRRFNRSKKISQDELDNFDMKDYCVFIGRFQPFHNAHLAIINNALKFSDNIIIVLGSKGKARFSQMG